MEQQTQKAIENLVSGFSKGLLRPELYRASLQSLVRLAIAEHMAQPILATQADMQRVAEIQEASRKVA